MHPPTSRRAWAAALISASALLAAGAASAAVAGANTTATATAATTTAATTTTAPKPELRMSWTVLRRACHTATKTVHVHGKAKKKRVRVCRDRAVPNRGRIEHLAWRQQGQAFGHLTLAGQPVAKAAVTVSWSIPHLTRGSYTVNTDANGRFTLTLTGPNKLLTVSYSAPAGGTVTKAKRIQATAFLSLKVGRLTAGKVGRFSGIVFGGHIPQDLYVQFWYHAGAAGWQPFSHLALVDRRNGHWATSIPIPKASRGYTYKIRASVVSSPAWPWMHTDSRTVERRVS
jgi:hypothetical protein